jgi:hypothetical protein
MVAILDGWVARLDRWQRHRTPSGRTQCHGAVRGGTQRHAIGRRTFVLRLSIAPDV